MPAIGSVKLCALAVASALLLAVPPQDVRAEDGPAKTCRKLGLPDGCVTNDDIKRKGLTADDFKDPAGVDFGFKPTGAKDVGFLGKVYAQVVLDVPGPGVVIVNASAYLQAEEKERGTVVCFLTEGSTGLVQSNNTRFFGTVNAFRPPPGSPQLGDPVDLFFDHMSLAHGFEVSRPGPNTIALVCKMQITTTAKGPLGLGAPTITAQYFPTRYCKKKRPSNECR